MRSERLTEPGYLGGIACMMARKGHDADSLLLIEQVEPGPSDGGIGKIGLVEDFQARPLAGQAQFLDQRIGAGVRDARIQHFNDDIDDLHRLGGFFARRIHVTGEPLDGHGGTGFLAKMNCTLAGC